MILFSSSRLYCREWNVSDAHWIKKLNENFNVVRYTGDSKFMDMDEVSNMLKNYDQYQKHGFGRWAVYLKENNIPIGWCGLKRNEESQIDIGFRFFEEYWGNGYATEAAKETLDYGFNELQLEEIIGRTSILNTAANRILVKIGMELWKKGSVDGIGDVMYYKIYNLKQKKNESNN